MNQNNDDMYLDFQIQIGAERAGRYPVSATLGDGGVFDGGWLALSDDDLVALTESALQYDPAAHGKILYRALFRSDACRDALQQALGAVRAPGSQWVGMRVRLAIHTDAPQLHALGWERLYCKREGDWAPLATSAKTPFSRYVALAGAHPPPPRAGAMRMLLVLANPDGAADVFDPIKVDAEVENVCAALDELAPGALGALTIMPGRTGLSAAQRAAIRGYREGRGGLSACNIKISSGPTSVDRIISHLRPGVDVFHLVGHGHFDRDSGSTTLHLEDKRGGWARVADDDIAGKVRDLRWPPRLVFLAACYGATRSKRGAFLGLAPKLVRAHVPAVIAMQDRVRMDHARTLTRYFYESVFDHGVVDLALSEARSQLHASDSLDWGIPALFTRLKDGRLFPRPTDSSGALRPVDASIAVPVPYLGEHWVERVIGRAAAAVTAGSVRRAARWLVTGVVAAALLIPLAFEAGARALRARELLIGIPEPFDYPALEQLITGLRMVPELFRYMTIGPWLEGGIESWLILPLLAMSAITWWLYRRRRAWLLIAWLALGLLPVAAGAVFQAHAAGVSHAAMYDADDRSCAVGRSVPAQIRFEVCSWLRNPGSVNHGRRIALAGLAGWFAFALLVMVSCGARLAYADLRRSRWRVVVAVVLGCHAWLFIYVAVQVPKTYAIAHWGLLYPHVSEIRPGCSTNGDDPLGPTHPLQRGLKDGRCQVVDVTAGAAQEALIVWGRGCFDSGERGDGTAEPSIATQEVKLIRLYRGGDAPDKRCVTQTDNKQTILNWKE